MSAGRQIVHLGLGAFHRAHQAVYTQDANDAMKTDWRITGVSLRSRAVVDALNAQGGRYTLVIRAPQGPQFRRIATHGPALSGVQGMGPILATLTAPETQIVTLTVTEKGYVPDPGEPTDVIGLLTQALAARQTAGAPGLTLLSCDNMVENGQVLSDRVLTAARPHPGLPRWIEDRVAFPSSMVDRITPATPPDLADEVRKATGFADAIPVQTEPFSQWVIEDRFASDRPAWEAAGAQFVTDVAPYETLKLRMLNGAHSLLAYLGYVSGKPTVRDVMADPDLAACVGWYMTAAAATLDDRDGLDWTRYRSDLLERFANPSIAHETYQIAMDGSQKLPHRVFSAALVAAERGQDLSPFALATAAWARYTMGLSEGGERYDLRDPRAAELTALPRDPEARVTALFAMPDLVPPALARHDRFRSLTHQHLRSMLERSVAQALRDARVQAKGDPGEPSNRRD